MICHIDADAFFASALQRKRPDLKGKKLLALGMGGGCVIAASYEAKACGVKTGMRLVDAKKLCPDAIALPSDFDEALLASRQIEGILQDICPVLQRYSVDEWFLDLVSLPGGLKRDLAAWGKDMQNEILAKTALTVSLGIGESKLLSKMASEYRKPAGLTIVSHTHSSSYGGRGAMQAHPSFLTLERFLQDRPAAAIPGIGKRRELHAEAHGWKTAWSVAHAPPEMILKLFGRPGIVMQRELQGERMEKVEKKRSPPKSISRCRSFPPTTHRDIIYSHLLHHVTYTLIKMRRENLACRLVSVWMRGVIEEGSGRFPHESRESKLPQPMDTEEQLLPYIVHCFEKIFEAGNAYTQVGLALLALHPKGGTQYSLFECPRTMDEAEDMQEAMDTVHKRFGRASLKRGAAMAVRGSKKQHVHLINEYQ